MFWSLLSLAAGIALGWWHFRRCEGMVDAMMGQAAGAPFRRMALTAGMSRHIFTFAAGIFLIRVAGIDPFHLAGGLLVATLAYRVYVLRWRESRLEGDEISV